MTDSDIRAAYSERYSGQKAAHLYPVEFVVRAFLGTYPALKLDRSRYAGATVLDLGFGDGRNMPLLHDLGFRIHGTEIHGDIVSSARDRLHVRGLEVDLRVGTNANIPFEREFFDCVLACHSCYYVEGGMTFGDNLREIARVMKRGGLFVCSLPMRDTYILEGAEVLSAGHFRIRHDPYGLRAGTVFRAFESADEVAGELRAYFDEFRIGFCDDLYWGIRQKVWIVVCNRS